ELGVIGCPALVEAEDPDVSLLHLLEGADEVGDAGDANVFGGSRGGLRHRCGDGSGAALGQDDAVDSGSVSGAKQSAEIVRVLNSVEGEEEAVLPLFFVCQKVFDA